MIPLEDIERAAHTLLQDLLDHGPTPELVAEHLRPRADDWERVFEGSLADTMRAAYEPLWSDSPPVFGAKPEQDEIRVAGITSDDLRANTGRAGEFPGGYQQLADRLVPGRIWLRFKFVERGHAMGMAFDGLVWLDDHWAWFPKPWRAARG